VVAGRAGNVKVENLTPCVSALGDVFGKRNNPQRGRLNVRLARQEAEVVCGLAGFDVQNCLAIHPLTVHTINGHKARMASRIRELTNQSSSCVGRKLFL
jgi:hypothetical protein